MEKTLIIIETVIATLSVQVLIAVIIFKYKSSITLWLLRSRKNKKGHFRPYQELHVEDCVKPEQIKDEDEMY